MRGGWLNLIGDPRLWRGPLLSFLVFTAALNVVVWRAAAGLRAARAQNLMAGQDGPAGGGGEVEGPIRRWRSPTPGPPRFDFSVGEAPEEFLPTIPDATARRLAVFSSMSQAYVVNDREPSDRLFVERIDDALEPAGAEAWGFFAPNLCNEEVLLQLLVLLRSEKSTPALFVHALCFDKYRNVDLRPGYRALLESDPALLEAWRALADRASQSHPQAAAKMRASAEIFTATTLPGEEPFAKTLERRIRAAAGRVLPMVAERSELNGYVQARLFQLRNAVLRIKPTSKRPVLRSRYEMNLEFLELVLELAKERGVEPLLYIVPLNPQAETPYVESEYEAFKATVRELAGRHGVAIADLEGVVPAGDWGEFMGGADFKHFRGAGHDATADALLREFGDRLRGDSGGGAAP